jgi:hypothetical protein
MMLEMSANGETGTVNLTNPGVISHNEILEMYKKHVDPEFVWKNFSGPELLKVIAAARSNNKLATSRLQTLFPSVRSIQDAVEHAILSMKSAKLSATDDRLVGNTTL